MIIANSRLRLLHIIVDRKYFSYHNQYQGWGSPPQNDWNRGRWNGEPDSPFVRSSEASVKDAFASIESIVTAFTSVAQMLEATYNSVHSSFRAVLSVADHFSKLRQQLVKILRSFMMLGIGQRVFQRLWNSLTQSTSPHEAVQNVQSVAWDLADPAGPQDLWPFVTFLLVACAGPYFIYKMFPAVKEDDEIDYGDTENETATVVYPYRALNPDEISVPAAAEVIVAPAHLQPVIQGWTLVSYQSAIGLIPSTYIELNT